MHETGLKRLYDSGVEFALPVSGLIPATDGYFHVAMLVSGVFRADARHPFKLDHGGWFVSSVTSPTRPIYYPIAPGTTVEDINGATHAHDDGTHWHFAHATPGQHHDTEAVIEALVIAHFQPRINRAIQAVAVAGDITSRTLANNYLDALNGLTEIVMDHAEKTVRGLTLGEHERESPEKDNNRIVVVAAIRSALAAMKKKAEDSPLIRYQIPALEAACAAVISELTATPTIETRTQRVARLAKEAKAKEASSEDS